MTNSLGQSTVNMWSIQEARSSRSEYRCDAALRLILNVKIAIMDPGVGGTLEFNDTYNVRLPYTLRAIVLVITSLSSRLVG